MLHPFPSTTGGFAEPGIYEKEDGTLWVWIRTWLGHQYDTLSTDGGKTWLTPEPNLKFTSTDSPMRVKKVGDLTFAVFNPIPYHCLNEMIKTGRSPRTPLICAVSNDDADSFTVRGASFATGSLDSFIDNVYLLEDDMTQFYCYPSITKTKDGFLVSYYCYGATSTPCLQSTRIVKIYRNEIT